MWTLQADFSQIGMLPKSVMWQADITGWKPMLRDAHRLEAHAIIESTTPNTKAIRLAKILVLYHSNSGHTEHMAQLIAEGAGQLSEVEVRIKSVEVATHLDLEWCDGIALGSPTNYGSVSWQMKQWWDQQPIENWGKLDGKIGCVFSSGGAWGGGQEWTCMALMSILINYGFLVFGLTDYTGVKFSAHYGAIAAGSPTVDKEKEACRRLGLRLAEWVASLINGRQDAHPLKQTYTRFADLGK